jgi:DNA-binding MarR family transcriptional regulator
MNRSKIIAELFDTMDAAKRSMHGHMQTVVQGHNITRPQLELLFTIHHHQPTTAKHLAQKLNLTPGSISQSVEDLLDQGLIERQADPTDRRRQVIRVSAEGDKIFKALDKRRHEVMNKVIDHLSDEELLTWLKIQKHLTDVFHQLHQDKERK